MCSLFSHAPLSFLLLAYSTNIYYVYCPALQHHQLRVVRYDIVTGAVEVDGAKEEDAMDQTDDTEKGVPEFWLTAMKHNEITAEEITERDEEALKYLKDIKWCRMDDPKGFKLEFFFDTNPLVIIALILKEIKMNKYT
ncbi:nucleosome assembly protein [Artemisia annua]|uniref:Nucleosome assembly protein n=1 Tax=Artemisia annua TaxID=35608 RepID=A0A2U1PHS2_ARTAN|nr:nucleosome assembly protein [Artemisia annua]